MTRLYRGTYDSLVKKGTFTGSNIKDDQKRLLTNACAVQDCDVAEVEEFIKLVDKLWARHKIVEVQGPYQQGASALDLGVQTSPGDLLSQEQRAAIALVANPLNRSGFLYGGQLEFVNFTRPVVAIQMIARIIDYKLIDQASHGLCAVAALVSGVLRQYPQNYAKYVIDVATTRDGYLNVGNKEGLHVHIKKSSSILQKPSRIQKYILNNPIPEADYIAMASLKNSQCVLPYRNIFTNTMIQGGTSNGSIKEYMEKVGFTDCQEHACGYRLTQFKGESGRDALEANLRLAQKFLAWNDPPYTVIMTASRGGNLANKALGQTTRSHGLEVIFGGHAVLLRGLAIGQNGVSFDIVTWTKESDVSNPVYVSWEDIQKSYNGFICGVA